MRKIRIHPMPEGMTSKELSSLCETEDATWDMRFSAFRELMRRHLFSDEYIAFIAMVLDSEDTYARHMAYEFALTDICTMYNLCSDGWVSSTIARMQTWIESASRETDIRLLESSWLLRYIVGDEEVSAVASVVGPPLRLTLQFFVERFHSGDPIIPLTLIMFPSFKVHDSPIYKG